LQEKFFMGTQIKDFRNPKPQCVIKSTDKENSKYENFDNANVEACLLRLFNCSGKECRLQVEPYKFQKVLTSCLQLLFSKINFL
jgi:hypothetical protein